ncbi:MAG: TonB-dependent receptor [Ignavibacteriales bacterium]|nr:TonB-dependent receptor [Ignavibacteriales bacterium]
MSKSYKLILILLSLLFAHQQIMAQGFKITGTVTDGATGEKLIGASVFIADQNIGGVTNLDGFYTIENVKEGTYQVTASYIGYLKQNTNVKISGNTKLNVSLVQSSVLLDETVVKGTRAVLRETPIAFTEIKGEQLEFKLASRDVPMELAETPSVYASPSGGGAGDAVLYVRGFDQRNVAIMVNGVPVNDMENKSVYWSNWQGLGDVTDNIQVQRGLGASPYSVSAVGGLINMTTKGVGSEQEYVKLRSEYGSSNLRKSSIAFHQKLSNKISATAFVARRTWDGYTLGTYADDWTYFFSVGGVFGNHSIELTGLGSPQEHGQRGTQMYFTSTNPKTQTYEKRGHQYNPNVGVLNGTTFNDRVNKFHKPAFNLNWNWQIDKKTTLSTIAYSSFGRGYGTSGIGSFAAYRDYDGLEDYDAIFVKNSAASTIDTRYSPTLHKASTIRVNSVNNHNWFGVLSTLTEKLGDLFTLTAGIDGRLYTGIHYQEVRNLLGGDYYLDTKDVNTPAKMTFLGDKVAYYNDTYVRQIGGFGQLEYKAGAFTSFVNLSLSTTGNQRKDYFLYKSNDPFNTTAWQNFTGYTAKTGARYNLDDYHSIFANVGYFSTAPLPNTIFTRNTNVVSKGAVNEKVTGLEFGYEFNSQLLDIDANAFYTNWKDRAMVPFAVYTTITDPITGMQSTSTSYVNVVGANELHYGGELEVAFKPVRKLTISGNVSLINARYTNDVDAAIWPEEDPTKVTMIRIYSENLFVSQFPQTQATLKLNYSIYLGSGLNMYINPVYKFYGRHFARFFVDDRTNPNDRQQPWRIPDYNITDFHLGFTYYITDFFVKKINLNFHVFNVFNNDKYIVEATDGPSSSIYGAAHTYESAKGFYGRERWYNVGVAFTF